MTTRLLNYSRILVVDDEPDVLDTMESLLNMCEVVKARTFEEGKNLLEIQHFDIAILDIMGVDGYGLLEIAIRKNVIPIMLTAHALSPEDTIKSYNKGAAYYVPKEKMGEITTYLEDVLEAKEKGKNLWSRWLNRFASYYDEKFGRKWMVKDKEFWERMGYWE
ncbi:MAG: response regulator [Deltaproteobacteria bacterium HGW-Deltaproteobacteria-21]|nr:MAG: response regulator [Deltaproteobacteria bacterium HGW-Deltaproteobacteria-21]